jgi:hypothetical protein
MRHSNALKHEAIQRVQGMSHRCGFIFVARAPSHLNSPIPPALTAPGCSRFESDQSEPDDHATKNFSLGGVNLRACNFLQLVCGRRVERQRLLPGKRRVALGKRSRLCPWFEWPLALLRPRLSWPGIFRRRSLYGLLRLRCGSETMGSDLQLMLR